MRCSGHLLNLVAKQVIDFKPKKAAAPSIMSSSESVDSAVASNEQTEDDEEDEENDDDSTKHGVKFDAAQQKFLLTFSKVGGDLFLTKITTQVDRECSSKSSLWSDVGESPPQSIIRLY